MAGPFCCCGSFPLEVRGHEALSAAVSDPRCGAGAARGGARSSKARSLAAAHRRRAGRRRGRNPAVSQQAATPTGAVTARRARDPPGTPQACDEADPERSRCTRARLALGRRPCRPGRPARDRGAASWWETASWVGLSTHNEASCAPRTSSRSTTSPSAPSSQPAARPNPDPVDRSRRRAARARPRPTSPSSPSAASRAEPPRPLSTPAPTRSPSSRPFLDGTARGGPIRERLSRKFQVEL